jgi:hypothetical protein
VKVPEPYQKQTTKRACRKTFFEKTLSGTPLFVKQEPKSPWKKENKKRQMNYGHNKTEEAASPMKKFIYVCQAVLGICK